MALKKIYIDKKLKIEVQAASKDTIEIEIPEDWTVASVEEVNGSLVINYSRPTYTAVKIYGQEVVDLFVAAKLEAPSLIELLVRLNKLPDDLE